jgi:asparagine synthase (glutamine-hydrolysing)
VCGIVGVLDYGGNLPAPEAFLKCVEKLRRRGPDDSGVWSDRLLRLGHRRLSVIDLSPTGHQPMTSADGRYVITFNGEIYNHARLREQLDPPGGWRGTSDTETLLEAYRVWGSDCLNRLNGMFAFAIWDSTARRMFLARDRMGVKPLYYSWRNGRFVFASRPGPLLDLLSAGGTDIDPEAVRVYLELGYIPAPLSFYGNVRKLRPGHSLQVDIHGVRETRYWDFRQIAPDASLLHRSEASLIDELDELIRDATRLRLMSDVPVGVFLSGGTDSAYITAAMKAVGVAAPHAFTIGFNEPSHDEGPAAARIAHHIGVRHAIETMSVEDLLELLPTYVEDYDEPFADSSAFPTMAVARLARRQVTVALTGDGADELFAGYHYYPIAERLARICHWPAGARRLLRGILGLMPSHRAKLLAGALVPQTPGGIFNYLRSSAKDFGPLVSDALLRETSSSRDWFERVAAEFAPGLGGADIGTRLDMAFTLVDGYLQKVDVATMAHSLEARNPFLDYRLIEWSMRLPMQFKIRNGQSKYLLKKALCRYLPENLVYRPKQGFGVPAGNWLRGPLKSWAQELIHDRTLMQRVQLDQGRVCALLDLHGSGSRDAHPILWAVLMLLCHVARHDRGLALPPVITRHAA